MPLERCRHVLEPIVGDLVVRVDEGDDGRPCRSDASVASVGNTPHAARVEDPEVRKTVGERTREVG